MVGPRPTCRLGDVMVICMSTLQIRDVPEDVHRTLKSRAATEGKSLSEFALGELTRVAQRPTLRELAERVRARGSVDTATSAAALLEEARDARP